MNQIKFPSVSKETKEYCDKEDISSSKKKGYKGLTPADPYECSCQKLIQKMYKAVGEGKKSYYVECDRKKIGMSKYNIVCSNCANVVAEVYATDLTLKDYCDLHYICQTDGKNWYGALALNLSPIDGKIGIECACGQDTRDFRANNTLPYDKLSKKIVENLKGRDFGLKDSKFKLMKV